MYLSSGMIWGRTKAEELEKYLQELVKLRARGTKMSLFRRWRQFRERKTMEMEERYINKKLKNLRQGLKKKKVDIGALRL